LRLSAGSLLFLPAPCASQIDTHFLNMCNLSLGLRRALGQPRKSHERSWPADASLMWAGVIRVGLGGPQTLPLIGRGVDRHFHSRAEGHRTTPRMRIERPGGLEGSIGALRRIQHASDGPPRRPQSRSGSGHALGDAPLSKSRGTDSGRGRSQKEPAPWGLGAGSVSA
jgi:hypothetical protein